MVERLGTLKSGSSGKEQSMQILESPKPDTLLAWLIPISIGLTMVVLAFIFEYLTPRLIPALASARKGKTVLAFSTSHANGGSAIETLAYDLVKRLVNRYPQDIVKVPIGDVLTQGELGLICSNRLGFARAVDRYAYEVGRKAYFEETGLGTTESIYWIRLGLPLD